VKEIGVVRPVRAPGGARANDFAARAPSTPRVTCGARRRSDGEPCQALSVPGRRRCKWHGGMSTGPRSAEGKLRVAANLPRRVSACIAGARPRANDLGAREEKSHAFPDASRARTRTRIT
jgi:hypothetical protein